MLFRSRLLWLGYNAWRDEKRLGSAAAIKPQSKLDFRVGLLDIDINRHLTNSRYLFYMDLGRWDLFLRSGRVQQSLRESMSLAMVELDVKFRHELRPWQAFRLDSRVIEIRAKLVTFEHYFIVGDKIHAHAQAKVLVTRRGKVIVPDDFMNLVSPRLLVQNWRVKAESVNSEADVSTPNAESNDQS